MDKNDLDRRSGKQLGCKPESAECARERLDAGRGAPKGGVSTIPIPQITRECEQPAKRECRY